MRIGLITPDPGHPLLAAATALLAADHRVETLDPDTAAEAPGRPADVYLLKSRTPRALALARGLEEAGARVLNSAAATGRCQDRTVMAELALRAGLPFARTRTYDTAGRLGAELRLPGPVVVKSRHSRKHDLVVRVDDEAGLREFAARWPREPVVVQDFAPNSGWDHKLWVIGGRLFAALRRSELAAGEGDSARTRTLDPAALPPGWDELARRTGEVFGLDVYGVDVIDTGGGVPLIVDVNAFPGVRGPSGAPEALAALALRAAADE